MSRRTDPGSWRPWPLPPFVRLAGARGLRAWPSLGQVTGHTLSSDIAMAPVDHRHRARRYARVPGPSAQTWSSDYCWRQPRVASSVWSQLPLPLHMLVVRGTGVRRSVATGQHRPVARPLMQPFGQASCCHACPCDRVRSCVDLCHLSWWRKCLGVCSSVVSARGYASAGVP